MSLQPASSDPLDTLPPTIAQRSALDWQLADQALHRSQALRQSEHRAVFKALAAEVGVSHLRLSRLAKIAEAYPPDRRDPALTFEHYAGVFHLPEGDRESLIAEAKQARINSHKTRVEALRRKAFGSEYMPRDDPEYDELMRIVRAWNRAGPDARGTFAELVEEADCRLIEA